MDAGLTSLLTTFSRLPGRVALAFARYCRTGAVDNSISERNHQVVMVNLFGLVGQSITLVLGCLVLAGQSWQLAIALLGSSIIFSFGHHIVKRSGNYNLAAKCIFYILIGLMTYLVYSGGMDNTGPLWIYVVPPVALFFFGLRRGMIDTLLFIALIAGLMFYQRGEWLAADYTQSFKVRVVLSFLTVTFLFGYYEYSRQLLFRHLLVMRRKYEREAKQDSLTRLSNRRGIAELLDYEFSRILRHQGRFTIMLCDIDDFKKINDNYGHDNGDTVLIALAETFSRSTRKQDAVARWGGEEFLLMLPDTRLEEGTILAEKLRRAIAAKTFDLSGASIHLTVSIGLAEVSPSQDVDQAIRRADTFLYKAKQLGKNRVVAAEQSDLHSVSTLVEPRV